MIVVLNGQMSLSKPSSSNQQFAEDFKRETGTFFIDRIEYKVAIVLVLHWQDHDLNETNRYAPRHTVETEIRSVVEFFRDQLNFRVFQFALPSISPGLRIVKFLTDAVLDLPSAEASMVVVYYAGHNDKADDGKAVLAALVHVFLVLPQLVC